MASSYGKVSEADQAALDHRRKSRRRIALISLSSVVLACVVVVAVVGTQSRGDKNGQGDKQMSTSVKAVCDVTLYKDTCYSSMSDQVNPNQVLQPQELLRLSMKVAITELSKVIDFFSSQSNGNQSAALDSCQELLSLAMDHLNDSYSSGLGSGDDLRTWLSTAGTCQETCIDGLEELAVSGTLQDIIKNHLKTSQELTSNSLAIVTWISNIIGSLKVRRLLSYDSEMPEWVNPKDRKLLQSSVDPRKTANVVVAKDGSGKYKTIKDALKAVPDKSKERFVIYVKKGVYNENVRVEKSKWNVLIVGDGKDATIVSGSLNVVDGTPTFQSATFAVFGKGFIGRDMGFRNTAGPAKHQAVALMSTADQSIFYRCRMDAFQDTLYTHSNRQFYRECDIYGTVDFIFGNSAVVIQNSNILPKVPMTGQQNTITAQGKADPNMNTGISIHNCTIWPAGNLSSVHTFLGRPWKNYSTTVYMKSMMSNIIDPKGWLPWVGTTAPNTIYYAEFANFGPGASTKNRVKWKGLRFINPKEATKFTVKPFIGEDWIKSQKIPYNPNL